MLSTSATFTYIYTYTHSNLKESYGDFNCNEILSHLLDGQECLSLRILIISEDKKSEGGTLIHHKWEGIGQYNDSGK